MSAALRGGGFASYRSAKGPVLVQLSGRQARGRYWNGFEVVSGRDHEMAAGLLTPVASDAPEVILAIAEGERLENETPTIDEQLAGLASHCAGCDLNKVTAKLVDGLCAACLRERREAEARRELNSVEAA